MKNKYSIVLSALLVFSAPVLVSGCGLLDRLQNALVNSSYKLNYTSKTVVAGEEFTIYLYPKESTSEEDRYDNVTRYIPGSTITSSDPNVASVTNAGVVTPLNIGECDILYDIAGTGSMVLKCHVKVVQKELRSISVIKMKTKYAVNKDFVFRGTVYAKYQTDFEEPIVPTVDSSQVDTTTLGNYNITISYSLNGVTKSITKQIQIVTEEEANEKIKLEASVTDLNRNEFGMHNTGLPTEGSPKMLIIPIMFTNSDTYISSYANVKEDINSVFFGEGTSNGYYSVKSYYYLESLGLLNITGKVSDWYVSNKSSYDAYTQSLQICKDAVEWYFTSNSTENRQEYDYDHDGFLDGVCFVYGSLDRSTGSLGGAGQNMWASVISSGSLTPNTSKPGIGKHMWISYDFLYQSNEKALERTGKSNYSEPAHSGNGHIPVNLHTSTFIHESGHMLGLNDYYSYTTSHKFAGGYTMQDESSVSHESYSRMLYNWADPYIPDDTITIDINDLETSNDCIILSPHWNDYDSPFDEYILIDLYTPTGLNKFRAIDYPSIRGSGGSADDIAEAGIRIWHVDARVSSITSSTVHSEPHTNAKLNNITQITDNSPDSYTNGLSEYDKYAELFQIRNDTSYTFSDSNFIRKNHFFKKGDTFTMEKFKNQFVNVGKLDSGIDLGWEVSVDNIFKTLEGYTATLTLTKK